MGYSFMTIEKIKNPKQMMAKYKHNYREKEVLNADPEKQDLNEELVKLNGKTYNEMFEERTKSLGYGTSKNIRKNAVYGFEVVTTFSREDAETMDLEKWKQNNVEWLRSTFNANPEKYGDNVLSVMYHADEPGNVHCHAFIIPIDDKGNLNARYYVQNRTKMIALQNSYGKLMKKEHNLNRGVKNSKAKHQDIKRYYTALNMTLAKDLPLVNENETAADYRSRVNEIYKNASLKIMGLEDKLKRMTLEHTQLITNAVAEAKKELYDRFQEKANHMDELEREYGSYHEIKGKCENYDNLIIGVADEDQRDDIVALLNQLIENGKRIKEKENRKYNEEIL